MRNRRLVAFAALAMFASMSAYAEWHEASSRHFVVYSDDKPERVRDYTLRLERFDQALRALRNVPDKTDTPVSRVTVYVVEDSSDIRSMYSPGGARMAGFYIPTSEGPFAFVARSNSGGINPFVTLLHEYAHHFMYSSWPGIAFPKWYVEGFAEFHSTALFRDQAVVLGASPEDRTYGVAFASQLPLSELLQPDPGELSDKQTATLYARGWLLTHYLTFKQGGLRQLSDYVQALNDGKAVADAIKAFDGLSDLVLTNYAKRSTLPSLAVDNSRLNIGTVTVRALTAGEAAVMPARIRSHGGVDATTAPEVLKLARKLAAPHQNDVAAQLALAEAEFDCGHFAESEQAADRALAVDARSVGALIYKGRARMGVALKEKSTDAATWREIRRLFLEANKLAPASPVPLVAFYKSFVDAGQPPSKGAIDGLVTAYALAPYDMGLRAQAAVIFLEQGRNKLARDALRPVAFSVHRSEFTGLATKALEALSRDDVAAALELLMRPPEKEPKKT